MTKVVTVFNGMSIEFKVSTATSNGELLIIEHTDSHKGGPPRHLHHHQDEWFCALSGEYVVEVDGTKHHLGAGDSVFAPRQVPHVWAHLGEETGKLLIVFQPAQMMESFFDGLSKLGQHPEWNTLGKLFQQHDMELLGPSLLLSQDE